MTGIEIFKPMPLYVSESAVAKVRSLVKEEGNPDLKLRVFVTGGGCSGFQYGFSFDELVAEDDTIVEEKGVFVLADSLSIQYLQGSTVNYEEGLQGSKFSISNPNATATCGCGSSFSV
ncbi:MAG: iron-sulfur cluster insertion protein ErpA [Cellvibrionales bacterium]|jgi:iron-sulfur cluster insertion protein|nr:iron-sulfur cluster insertion protein ErpA [Cellvibrionales bacterium]MBT5836307.1 iron-sulfur cluster insertion protein ErpA [Hellea sp.]MBT7437388.1 iron-sulfur cluster insertion protein ErpA [Cellvibrionales bacterium]MCH9797717.1 iron-sulfur cluster insertion protein ErpA [Gammaproteobacteria bacterium]|tara:strand:+ start:126 stop:479 length:354 start_codon:yes stop_codon:yes gene_type:complete